MGSSSPGVNIKNIGNHRLVISHLPKVAQMRQLGAQNLHILLIFLKQLFHTLC